MVLILEKKEKKQIKVIAHLDSAVDCCEEDYQEYIESFKEGDPFEEILNLKEEPTRFIIKLDLGYEQDTKINRNESKIVNGKLEHSGSLFTEMFRLSFINIENPDGMDRVKSLRFKKDGDDGASKNLMASLGDAGILQSLILAWTYAKSRKVNLDDKNKEILEKKS